MKTNKLIKIYREEKEQTIINAYKQTKYLSEIVELLSNKKYMIYVNTTHNTKINPDIYKIYTYGNVKYVLNKYNLEYKIKPKIHKLSNKTNPNKQNKQKRKKRDIPKKDYAYAYRHAEMIWAYKKRGGKCEICGHSDYKHLVFHHIEPETKVDAIGRMIKGAYTKEQIQEEMDKCQLLCLNCHKNAHINLDKYERLMPVILDIAKSFV